MTISLIADTVTNLNYLKIKLATKPKANPIPTETNPRERKFPTIFKGVVAVNVAPV